MPLRASFYRNLCFLLIHTHKKRRGEDRVPRTHIKTPCLTSLLLFFFSFLFSTSLFRTRPSFSTSRRGNFAMENEFRELSENRCRNTLARFKNKHKRISNRLSIVRKLVGLGEAYFPSIVFRARNAEPYAILAVFH